MNNFQAIQKYVRPWVVFFMTGIFGFLIAGSALGWFADRWKEILTVFMSIYGPILGSWNGERSALKIPGKEETPVLNSGEPVPPTVAKAKKALTAKTFTDEGPQG